MKYAGPMLAGFFCLVVSLFAPLLVFLALPLIRWDHELTNGSYGQWPTVRGDLPGWLRWLQTPDERLPGGLYEPTVRDLLDRRGRVVCSWYWLGLRNRAHGLQASFGKPATLEQFATRIGEGFTDLGNGLWAYRKKLGPIVFQTGYRVYLNPMGYLAAPAFTFKKA